MPSAQHCLVRDPSAADSAVVALHIQLLVREGVESDPVQVWLYSERENWELLGGKTQWSSLHNKAIYTSFPQKRWIPVQTNSKWLLSQMLFNIAFQFSPTINRAKLTTWSWGWFNSTHLLIALIKNDWQFIDAHTTRNMLYIKQLLFHIIHKQKGSKLGSVTREENWLKGETAWWTEKMKDDDSEDHKQPRRIWSWRYEANGQSRRRYI